MGKMKIVYIEWVDACSENKWLHESDLADWIKEEEFIVQQVGYVLEETKHHLILAGRISPSTKYENQYGHLQKIPKTWIRKRVDLTKYI